MTADPMTPLPQSMVLEDRPGALAGALELAILRAASDGRTLQVASLSIDYGAGAMPGAAIRLAAQVDRATRSLVFARGEARLDDGAVAATASAVLRVVQG